MITLVGNGLTSKSPSNFRFFLRPVITCLARRQTTGVVMADRSTELSAEKETTALKKLQIGAGFMDKSRGERLDWMYEQSALTKGTDDEKLMNTAVAAQKDQDIEDVKSLQESKAGSMFLSSATNTTEDMLRKLREDPLFAIRRQEQAAKENMMANPLIRAKMERKAAKEAKKDAKKAKQRAKKEKKAIKKAKKVAKNEAKSAKKGKHSSSSSSTPSTENDGQKSARSSTVNDVDVALGPSNAMVNKREDFANQVAQRRDAALASRGAAKKMSEEEKRRRLEQMRNDAQSHEKGKDQRIAAADKREREIEELEKKMRLNSDQSYFKEIREQAYMGDKDASVADRIRNQRHKRQKHINDPLERDG